MEQRSAEWLRTALEVLDLWGSSYYDSIQIAKADYRQQLAAAEAREAGKLSKAQWIERYGGQAVLDREGFDVVPCVNCGDSVCHGWRVVPNQAREAAQPTTAEVIRVAKAALEDCRGNVANHPDGHHKQFIKSEEMAEQALAAIAAWEAGNGQ